MKRPHPDERCPLCNESTGSPERPEATLCSPCQRTVELLQAKPENIQLFCTLAGIPELADARQKTGEKELPEVLDAIRYRTTDRDRNTWYVSVSELEGEPVEIFASTAFDRDQHLQSRISNLTTITRLISLILRHVFMGEKLTLEKTLTQLRRSSRQTNDLPDMLCNVLANYSKQPATIAEKDHTTP